MAQQSERTDWRAGLCVYGDMKLSESLCCIRRILGFFYEI
ncbi:hypothetical protein RUMCAL_03232 [Ruminococcus callidus ATCC 27760]|uniref:Uncharacterized protein n=1 Tax=Ruminococcus callidus ATCC 27760 TaxID=411473 RepID=U2LE79_9FIRM|nr:hypothetical protein RUMCAL_03232 [Ruminococcus callidus ATCC 27760]